MMVLALALFYVVLPAQEAQLGALRTTLLPLRQHANERRETRGATAALTIAKHQLRDWVESRLIKFPEAGQPTALFEELRSDLSDSQLFCMDYMIQCESSLLGFLDDVQIHRDREFLIVRTSVGIYCGYDESVYVYTWTGTRWQRIWEHEQNTYTEKEYLPQTIHTLQISQPDEKGNRLLLTLGSRPACSGGFKDLYYRIWQMNASREVRPVLSGTEFANDGYPPIRGGVRPDDVLVQFRAGGTGYGSFHRAVRHFEVRDGIARQVDPIAPTPRDFVEQWLSAVWTESEGRSESPSLEEWHAKLHRDDGRGDFPDPAMRCTSSPDLWQIGTHLHEAPKTYYLVRWRQPYYFTMVGVSDHPYPDCTVLDAKADEPPDLFKDYPN